MEMAKTKLILFALLCFCASSCTPTYKWHSVSMDGSRTGCKATTPDNIQEALGVINEDGTYQSPSGKVFPQESTTAKVASIVMAAQPKMREVKKVIAHSEKEMTNDFVESDLSNWFVGIVMNKVSELSGKKIDVGICNFGGIRIGMPEGDVMLDDIKSMFPFKNDIAYLELSGRSLREIFEKMAKTRFEVLGGVRIEVEDKNIVLAQIGGEPIDDDKIYSVATISFLLHGGDGLTLAENASNLKVYDVAIVDAVLEHVYALTAEGKSIKGSDVTHVVIR